MSRLLLTQRLLHIPFKQVFVHATASRKCTETLLVIAKTARGLMGVGEGCPRSYVTGETLETVHAFFESQFRSWEEWRGVEDLRGWMVAHHTLINSNPAAWCAGELALLDVWAKESNQTIEGLLGLTELDRTFRYSAVLGAENMVAFQSQVRQFSKRGFTDFKVKISGRRDEDRAKIHCLQEMGLENLRIRLDANNLWNRVDEATSYLQALDYPFWAIEEPLQRGDYAGCREIISRLGCPIILDESFLRQEHFDMVNTDPNKWILNLRISKMGGILRSLAVARQAKDLGIPLIIGAQVGETSILTRAALCVANQCRDILIAQEGAFGTYLLERDLTDSPLMFGEGGFLDPAPIIGFPGLGIATNSLGM